MTFTRLSAIISPSEKQRPIDSIRSSFGVEGTDCLLNLCPDAQRARAAKPQLRIAARRPFLQTLLPCRKFQSHLPNTDRSLCRPVRRCLCHQRSGGGISCDWESVQAYQYSNHANSIRQPVREHLFHPEG